MGQLKARKWGVNAWLIGVCACLGMAYAAFNMPLKAFKS